jgi:ribosome-associated protein
MEEQTRPAPARTSPEDHDRARALALTLAGALDEAKCEDIAILDVHDISQVTDFYVIGTGVSDRQMRTAAAKAADAGEEAGSRPFGREGEPGAPGSGWLVLDFIDVVVHIFEPATRGLYDLEMLWGDAGRVPLPRAKRG